VVRHVPVPQLLDSERGGREPPAAELTRERRSVRLVMSSLGLGRVDRIMVAVVDG
jgi:hypothetical protein